MTPRFLTLFFMIISKGAILLEIISLNFGGPKIILRFFVIKLKKMFRQTNFDLF